jgi:hypothetical protein
MTKEVLTLALEALKLSDTVFYPQTKIAIAAIERALANHIEDNLVMVQEPVAWMSPSWIDPDTRGWQSDSFESIPIEGWLPIYITPPQRTEPVCPECKAGVLYECVACSSNNYPPQRTWVGLTDREFEEVTHGMEDLEDCWIAIEQALKEKNA